MQICPSCGVGNPDGQKFCGNCGTALDKPRQAEGERRFATFLFADVANSSALAEGMDAEDWTAVMNGAFSLMNAAVSRYGGTVSRLMGDAVLALFGAPVAHEDDALRAVRAGLDIQAAARGYAETVRARHGIDFRLRVGIHSGHAVLAFVGDAIRTEYTAMGDAANVAARLQSAAEPGSVLISADTHALVRGQVEAHSRGPLEIKGKQTAIEAYEVTSVVETPEKGRGLEGLSSPIVGRAGELAVLGDRLAGLGRGQGAVVAIIGDAGLGKSRLLAEFRDDWQSRSDGSGLWLEGRAISYGQSIPYLPWRQITRQILGVSEMEPAAAVRASIEAFARAHALPEADVPLIETMLSVDSEASRARVAGLSGDAVAEGIAGAVTDLLRAVMGRGGAAQPLVLVLDDLHWSDSASIELVGQVATLATYAPLLLVCVMRPHRKAASWQLLDRLDASLGGDFWRIALEPLSAADADALLGNLLDVRGLPARMRALILERADGNPFYIEEILRSLIDGGQIVREGDHWRATTAILETRIPETLAGVLSARIDRLPAPTKRVAQTAAVIGRIFPHRLLQTVCEEAPENERVDRVEPHLAALSLEQLVRERARDPDREYIFKHIMTCEAAYNLLLRSRRRELHARTGRALERESRDRMDEFAGVLAHHFAEAEEFELAVAYSRQAADRAAALSASHEELQHRERVQALLMRMPDPDPATLIDSTIAWLIVRHKLNRYEGAIEAMERAVAVAREAEDKPRLALALSWLGNVHMLIGHPTRGIPYVLESRGLAEEIGDEQLMLLPLFVSTFFLADRNPEAAVAALKEVIELSVAHRISDVRGHAIASLAASLARLGRFPEARLEIQRALATEAETISPVKKADIHIGVSQAYLEMGEWEKAAEHSSIGAELAGKANGFECVCAAYFGLGRSHMGLRQIEDSLADFEKSLAAARNARTEAMQVFSNYISGSIAGVQFEQGQATALDRMRDSMNLTRSSGDDFGAAAFGMQLAQALQKLGRLDEADHLIADALALFRERHMASRIADALEVLAELRAAQGRGEEAEAARAESAALRASFETVPRPDTPVEMA